MNNKVDSSIVNKISRRQFFETLSHFIIINIILFIFFSIAIVSTGERLTQNLIAEQQYSELSYTAPFGIRIPFANETQSVRILIYERNPYTWRDSTLIYRVWATHESGYAAYDYDFSNAAMLAARFFIILIVIQLLMLFSGTINSRRATKNALRPLAELTEMAQSINKKTQTGDGRGAAELRDLVGKLDSIDAEKLETRISTESQEKELSGLATAINSMLERINESYNSQVRFVSDASHELRTPISVIQGYANLLDRWGKNDEKVLQESIDTIKSEAQNMKDLVEQLLFLARGDNDSMRLNIETLNVCEIVSEIIRETEMIAPSRSISLKTEGDIYIYGDAQLIKQALRILTDNSMKYSPEKESVRVTLSTEDDKVKISVSDSGIGIPSEDLPYIFDRFFRSDDSRTRKTGGSGLGLPIAKWIIERHGGSLEVISRKDIGTRITLTLDAVKSE